MTTEQINWQPWTRETQQLAQLSRRPLYLWTGHEASLGSRRMAKRCFADPAIVERLNRDFVPVRINRWQEPLADQFAQSVGQLLLGAGGWPLSLWLTPEGTPFFARLYLEPDSSDQTPGLRDLLTRIAQLWKTDAARLSAAGQPLLHTLSNPTNQTAALPRTATFFDPIRTQLSEHFDSEYGGFGLPPKFPAPQNIRFLLRQYAHTRNPSPYELALDTLQAISQGGISAADGTVYHCSLQADWSQPQPEQHLTDQALLALAHFDATRLTDNPTQQVQGQQLLRAALKGFGPLENIAVARYATAERPQLQSESVQTIESQAWLLAALTQAGDSELLSQATTLAEHLLADAPTSLDWLNDGAALLMGLTKLELTTSDSRLREPIEDLVEQLLQLFHDPTQGDWYLARTDDHRQPRQKDTYDGAAPSGGATMTSALLQLGRHWQRPDWVALAEHSLQATAKAWRQAPLAHLYWLLALDDLLQ